MDFRAAGSFAPDALHFNWSRLNPANGFKRFGLMQSGVETLKTIVSVSVITYLSWRDRRTRSWSMRSATGVAVAVRRRHARLVRTPTRCCGAWHGRSACSRSATTPCRGTA